MANRIVLNTVSYHGAGAIKEIDNVANTKGFKHIFVASDLILLLILYTTAKGADISTKGYIISPNHILFSKNMCNTPYFITTVKVYNSKTKMILYKIFFISFYQYGIRI